MTLKSHKDDLGVKTPVKSWSHGTDIVLKGAMKISATGHKYNSVTM